MFWKFFLDWCEDWSFFLLGLFVVALALNGGFSLVEVVIFLHSLIKILEAKTW